MLLPQIISFTPIGRTLWSFKVRGKMEASSSRPSLDDVRELHLTAVFIFIFDILVDGLLRTNLESKGLKRWTTIPDNLKFQEGKGSHV